MISEIQLGKSELAIEMLSNVLECPEKHIVKILSEGMKSVAPLANQLGKNEKYFIDEMEATFGY